MTYIRLALFVVVVHLAGCASIPVGSRSWMLNTLVKSTGGSITSPNMEGPQTSVQGSVTQTYLSAQNLPVTVTPDAGYFISNLTMNGKVLTLDDPGTVYTTTVTGPPSQSIQTAFRKIPSTLNVTVGPHGTVSPSGSIRVRIGSQSPAKEFSFVPARGYSVKSIDVPGHLPDADFQLLDATTGKLVTLPAATDVRVKVSMVNVKSSVTLTGSFAMAGAYAGPTRTALAGTRVVLDGSASTGATSYSWSQISGPTAVALSGATTSRATFIASTRLGTYLFKLTTNGGASSSITAVQMTNSTVEAGRKQCQNCHDQSGVGVNGRVFTNWSTSIHAHLDNPVMCYTCHVGTDTGGHPGQATSSLGYDCTNCHQAAHHPFQTGSKACTFCHDAHSPKQFK